LTKTERKQKQRCKKVLTTQRRGQKRKEEKSLNEDNAKWSKTLQTNDNESKKTAKPEKNLRLFKMSKT
jgi:hypothetical protein